MNVIDIAAFIIESQVTPYRLHMCHIIAVITAACQTKDNIAYRYIVGSRLKLCMLPVVSGCTPCPILSSGFSAF